MTAPLDAPFLRACRGEPASRVPVWFMRQAGRSLPEYRALRGEGTILATIARPDVAAAITRQPVDRYGVDAAILYSDIVVPVSAIGFGVDIVPGTGPVVAEPFASARDLSRLRPLEPEIDTPYVAETIKILSGELTVPIIGFAGAPFTVASYLVEGRPSRTYVRTKALMYGEPGLWHRLMERLTEIASASLRSQILAGADAVQIFDSWAGALTPSDYEQYVLPHLTRLVASIDDLDVPRIVFGVDTGELLPLLARAGSEVVGIDWRVPLDRARARLDTERDDIAVQGNLDPARCTAGWATAAEGARDVLRRNGGRRGHIFNLGHGVLPETDPSVLERLVTLVHEEGGA